MCRLNECVGWHRRDLIVADGECEFHIVGGIEDAHVQVWKRSQIIVVEKNTCGMHRARARKPPRFDQAGVAANVDRRPWCRSLIRERPCMMATKKI